MSHPTRRNIIKTGLLLAGTCAAPALAHASATLIEPATRSLQFYNIHTGENLKSTYWELGSYLPESLKDIAYVLRDHRTGDMQPIDTRLLDLLVNLHRRLDSSKPFEVISGYRSPRSNAFLYETTSGVAVNSLHMSGRAIDIRLADRRLHTLRDTALGMRQGGVGYYPQSDFVHVDTGDVRHW